MSSVQPVLTTQTQRASAVASQEVGTLLDADTDASEAWKQWWQSLTEEARTALQAIATGVGRGETGGKEGSLDDYNLKDAEGLGRLQNVFHGLAAVHVNEELIKAKVDIVPRLLFMKELSGRLTMQ